MKLGLVLSGGGGKGGYEIGVWKYLMEIGLDKKISVISGTSVGGLNAALIGVGNFQNAEHIWTNEIEAKILDSENDSNRNGAIFSREGLLKIIDDFVDLNCIKFSGKKVYVTCYSVEDFQAEAFCLNYYDVPVQKKLLCATSAIPVAFQHEEIFGKHYIDGGIKENVPLSPLLKEKCTHALIVNLGDVHIDYSGFDIKVMKIFPSSNLGSAISGTMDFSHSRSKKRIELGYNDCKKNYSLQLNVLLQENVCQKQIINMGNFMNKDFYARASEINEMNDKKLLLETLKVIKSNPSLVCFIQCEPNLSMETQGGKVFWENLAEFSGWKFQRNKIFNNIRLLDELNNRKAWSLNCQKMIDRCRNFLTQQLKEEVETEQSSSTTADIEERLLKLKKLFEKDLISSDEFQLRKNEILSEI